MKDTQYSGSSTELVESGFIEELFSHVFVATSHLLELNFNYFNYALLGFRPIKPPC